MSGYVSRSIKCGSHEESDNTDVVVVAVLQHMMYVTVSQTMYAVCNLLNIAGTLISICVAL